MIEIIRNFINIILILSISIHLATCSPTTSVKSENNNSESQTHQKVQRSSIITQTTPAEMTLEEKKPVSPLLQSPLRIKYRAIDIEDIPPLSPKEESLEGKDEYYLGYHDVLRITVFGRYDPVSGTTDLVRETEIRDDGNISFPLVGDIEAAGLTIPDLQTNLLEKLKVYIVSPKIDIQIIKYGSRNVSILGEVLNPQVIFLKGRTTLLEAISVCGGLTPKASNSRLPLKALKL